GYSSKDDRLPQRLLEEPIKRGPSAGQYNRLPEMLPKYYAARGWDQNGVPTEAKIKELGIE
ncbi:MAG: aldehyde ferredoxin oxidoreductase, partial [Firmicutes bacterium]|nr:aldehyde ferredoxin oxidoreductase [Bacillota bacterium]